MIDWLKSAQDGASKINLVSPNFLSSHIKIYLSACLIYLSSAVLNGVGGHYLRLLTFKTPVSNKIIILKVTNMMPYFGAQLQIL